MSKNLASYETLLQKNPLFQGIPQAKLPCVLEKLKAHTRYYKKEETIRHCGSAVNFIGIVLEGDIHILQDDYYGNRSILATITPPQMFGEAFSCSSVRFFPVGVYAREDTTVMLLDCRRILGICSNGCAFHSKLIRNLLRNVAEKNLLLNQKIELTSKKTTKEKLMAYLLLQAKEHGSNSFTIPCDRQSLADYLGVERSAMSAEIGKLRDEGYIEVDRRYFRILKRM